MTFVVLVSTVINTCDHCQPVNKKKKKKEKEEVIPILFNIGMIDIMYRSIARKVRDYRKLFNFS